MPCHSHSKRGVTISPVPKRGSRMATTDPFDADHFHEECGVFGVYGHPDAAALTALGLHALQHRGQEATGIVAYDGEQFNAHRGLGQVSDNFSSKEVIARLRGNVAIGHVRYATTGEVAMRNVQPLFADFEFGGLAICHNGNLTNSYQVRRQLVRRGSLFQSTSDTEVIVHLIATSLKETVVDRLIDALRQVQGAFSLVALSQDEVIGVRDPLGVRPLVLGRLADAWILASETCALDIIGAEFVRDIAAGEIVIIGARGVKSLLPFNRRDSRFCVFEHIYFARPDSVVEGQSVYEVRKRIGRELARESPVDADIVVPVPDSGVQEVHMRISSPPTRHPCFYGIATPERDELLAARLDVAGMTELIGVDSLAFLSIDGLYRAMGEAGRDDLAPHFCDACFTGDYP